MDIRNVTDIIEHITNVVSQWTTYALKWRTSIKITVNKLRYVAEKLCKVILGEE